MVEKGGGGGGGGGGWGENVAKRGGLENWGIQGVLLLTWSPIFCRVGLVFLLIFNTFLA